MKTSLSASELLGLPSRDTRDKPRGHLLPWVLGALVFAFVIGFGHSSDPAAARVLLALTAATATLVVILLAETFASLRGQRSSSLATALPSHAALEEEKKQILTAIKELEFDRAMNKIDTADFEVLRARYERDALRVLKAIDEEFQAWRERAEALAQTKAAKAPASGFAAADKGAPESDAKRATVATPSARQDDDRACPSCKTSNALDAVFCKKCGSRLPGPKTCTACETENDADAEFCTRCGTGLDGAASEGGEP